MNILLVSSTIDPGGGIYLYNLAKGLERQGHEVALLLSDDPVLDDMVSGLSSSILVMRQAVKPTRSRMLGSYGALWDRRHISQVAGLFADVSPDVVHIDQPTAEDGLDLLEAARRSGIPHVSTIHLPFSPPVWGGGWGLLRQMVVRRALQRHDSPLIAVSEHAAANLKSWLPAKVCDRIVMIHNGVPVPTPTMGARVRVRERLTVVDQDSLVGAAGDLTAESGAMFLLDVMYLLDQRDGCPHLVWIGDGPLRERFEARAAELKLNNRVTVTGWVSRRADYMAALDCFCLPASRAGLPLALLEAMRLGMCCVANEVDGIGEALEADRSGVLLPVGDEVGWANVLETVLGDQEFRVLLGEGALKAARARFSLSGMASATGLVYETLLLEDALM